MRQLFVCIFLIIGLSLISYYKINEAFEYLERKQNEHYLENFNEIK